MCQESRRIILWIALISAAGCANLEGQTREADTTRQSGVERQIISPSEPIAPASRRVEPGTRQVTTILDPGSDQFLNEGLVRRSIVREVLVRDGPSEFSINLVDVTVTEAAHAILGEALKISYVVEGDVEGRISLESSIPIGREDLIDAFQTALEFNGLTMFESGDLISITQIDRAPPSVVPAGGRRGIGRRIVVIPLTFISTREMIRLLQPIVSANAVLWSSATRNLLMVSGSQAELDAIIDAVNLFDVDVLKGKSVALFKLRSARPEDVSAELALIFESEVDGSLEGVISFVPNERLGSILVVTSRARYLRTAQEWIDRLDTNAGRARRYAVVYQLQNRSAIELTPILASVLKSWSGSAPSLFAEEGDPDAETEEVAFIEDRNSASVVADDTSNAIVAWATGLEHESLTALIRQLDATPPQVLIEATIAEVTLNDELNFGVRWFFETGNFSFAFSDIVTGAATSSFPGFAFLFDGGSARLAINALSSVTDVNIISSPSLLVIDNREAELRVGDQVPIATQSAVDITDPNAPIVNSITLRDTGVLLKIRPRVSESGRIVMDIEQEVSNVVNTTTSGIDSPTIAQRYLKTSVAVDSGQTLALGGLVQDRTSTTKTKVPILGDIPLLGQLFKSKEDDVERRELLILITPRVIRDASEARLVTEEFRQRLSAPDALLDGRADNARHQLNRLFR